MGLKRTNYPIIEAQIMSRTSNRVNEHILGRIRNVAIVFRWP